MPGDDLESPQSSDADRAVAARGCVVRAPRLLVAACLGARGGTDARRAGAHAVYPDNTHALARLGIVDLLAG